jgi:hypothetical protein
VYIFRAGCDYYLNGMPPTFIRIFIRAHLNVSAFQPTLIYLYSYDSYERMKLEIYYSNKTYSASHLLDCRVHCAHTCAIAHHYSGATETRSRFLGKVLRGTQPLMDAVEQALGQLGVFIGSIHAERFDLV